MESTQQSSNQQNSQIFTESDFPIEPIWVLKTTLPSILSLPFVILFYIGGMSMAESVNPQRTFWFYVIFFFIFLVLPLPLHLVINILKRGNYKYSFESEYVLVKQGILSKQTRQIPYGVIQNVLVKRGILDRLFGLANLRIENASQGGTSIVSVNTRQDVLGFAGNFIEIPGLMHENAEKLKVFILERVKTHPVQELGL